MLRRLQNLFGKPGPVADAIIDNIHLYIETISRLAYETDQELSDELVRQGLSVDMAERLIAFVPEAFVRVLLAWHDFKFFPGYKIYDEETHHFYRFLLKDEPVFVVATALAKSLDIDDPMLTAVASCSAEAQIIGDLKNSDSIRDINFFTEPIFMRIPLPKKPS